jgi:uncharacterized protein
MYSETVCIDLPVYKMGIKQSRQFTDYTALRDAVKNNDVCRVTTLIERKADVNRPLIGSTTALHIAANNGCIDMVKLLVERNADIHQTDATSDTALSNSTCTNKEVIQYLVEKGCSINHRGYRGGTKLLRGLLNVQSVEYLQFLIEQKADTNKCDSCGISPLMHAMQKDSINNVRLLLDNAADIAHEYNNASVLSLAAGISDIKILELLIERKAAVNVSAGKMSPLNGAILRNRTDVAHVLIEHGADVNHTCDEVSVLMIASSRSKEIFALLVQHGADINYVAPNGLSVYHTPNEEVRQYLHSIGFVRPGDKVVPLVSNECSICLDTFDTTVPDTYAALKCGHGYHSNCLIPHILSNKQCPMCRKAIEYVAHCDVAHRDAVQ